MMYTVVIKTERSARLIIDTWERIMRRAREDSYTYQCRAKVKVIA